jgi:hypothetical protein
VPSVPHNYYSSAFIPLDIRARAGADIEEHTISRANPAGGGHKGSGVISAVSAKPTAAMPRMPENRRSSRIDQ